MKSLVFASIVATLLYLPQGTRPSDGSGGSPVYGAFLGGDDDGRFQWAIGYFSAEIQRGIRERIAVSRGYRSRLTVPSGVSFPADVMWRRRQRTEAAFVALSGKADIAQEAADFASAAPLAYEWEGYPDGPVVEAEYAAAYLRQHPQTALAPAIDLFLLYEYRCAFEAAGRTVKEYADPQQKEATRAIQRTAAADYVVVWQRLEKNSDAVIRAVAEDIDEQSYLYSRGEGHPRTFKARE